MTLWSSYYLLLLSLPIAFLFDIEGLLHQGPTCYRQAGTLASLPLHTPNVGPKLNLAMHHILLLWETNKSKCSKLGNSDTLVDTKECNCISIMTDTISIIDAKKDINNYIMLYQDHTQMSWHFWLRLQRGQNLCQLEFP